MTVWWHRVLMIPHVVRLSRRAPRGVIASWDDFWTTVTATGDDGDVLWDPSDSREVRRYLELLGTHADPQLPIVDIGCGNGRFTRALAGRFPVVWGVDVSPAALVRARAETSGSAGAGGTGPRITFETVDITEAGAGGLLRDRLGGDATVFVRGMFHVLDAGARREAAAAIAALVGERGVVLIAETNHRGDRLGYLESLGAGPRGIPPALAKVISSGLAPPLPFGRPELDDCFPPDRWSRIVSDADATITTVPTRTPGVRETLPGFVALLAVRTDT